MDTGLETRAPMCLIDTLEQGTSEKMVNYRRFIPATILIATIIIIVINSFVATVNSIAAKYSKGCSDYWGEIKLDLSYPLFKDELCLRIENYRPKNVHITILVKQIWFNYTRIPVPNDLWIEPGKTERLIISPGAEYKSYKYIVVKVWYSLKFSEKISYLEKKVVLYPNLLN